MGWLLRKLSIVVAVALLLLMPIAHGQGMMVVRVSSDKSHYSPGDTVTITGAVLDNQSNPILGAGVSIQANDPQGNTAHVQLVFSDQAADFQDSFPLSPNALQGEYQVYVAASKAGYDNTQASFQFSVLSTLVNTTSTIPPANNYNHAYIIHNDNNRLANQYRFEQQMLHCHRYIRF